MWAQQDVEETTVPRSEPFDTGGTSVRNALSTVSVNEKHTFRAGVFRPQGSLETVSKVSSPLLSNYWWSPCLPGGG